MGIFIKNNLLLNLTAVTGFWVVGLVVGFVVIGLVVVLTELITITSQ